jgi:large subunit ribosomal protein L28
MFGTDTPAKSNKSQKKGLFHMKTNHKRYQRCFSMKWSIVKQKPNVKRRNLFSDTLNKKF